MMTLSHQIEISIKRNYNKEIKILELRNTTEMKISLEGFNSRFELAEERISEFVDRQRSYNMKTTEKKNEEK